MSTLFLHLINRGLNRGIRDEQNGYLRLTVKQYFPKIQLGRKPGEVTQVMTSGLGASKELYGPFFDELLQRRPPIRATQPMETAHHGTSYVLNGDVI